MEKCPCYFLGSFWQMICFPIIIPVSRLIIVKTLFPMGFQPVAVFDGLLASRVKCISFVIRWKNVFCWKQRNCRQMHISLQAFLQKCVSRYALQNMQVERGDSLVNINYEYYLNHFHLLGKKMIKIAKTESRKGKRMCQQCKSEYRLNWRAIHFRNMK